MNKIYAIAVPFAAIIKRFPKVVLSLRYKHALGRKINLTNPVLFWDKIMWMSLYTDTSLWSKLADKYEVREFVKQKYNDTILNEIFNVYDSVKEINYDELPDRFVLKTTNSCTTNIIVKDKKKLDIESANKQLNTWLKYPYGELTGQLHYSKIKPRIIAENYLEQNDDPDKPLSDYKFYCFNGMPLFCNVLTDRIFNTHICKRNMYDLSWKSHPELFKKGLAISDIAAPKSLETMVDIAAKLSKGFPFVRVDLYEINNKPIFGEMTFMPGTDMGFTDEFQLELGNLIKL
jgi:hypothetical protein